MGITVDEQKQQIEEDLNEGATFDPPYVSNFGISNILQRVFGYLFGWNYQTGKPVKISCMSDGAIRTVTSASAVQTNDSKSGTTTNAWSAEIPFDVIVDRLDVTAMNNAIVVGRKNSATDVWQDDIVVQASQSMSIDAKTYSIRVKSHVTDNHGVYYINGWY